MAFAHIVEQKKNKVHLIFGFTGGGYISDGRKTVRKGQRFQGYTFAELKRHPLGKIRVPKPT